MTNLKAPVVKPVQPRSTHLHGMIGNRYLKQHFLVDRRWGADTLKEDFACMTQVIATRNQFAALEEKRHRREIKNKYRTLLNECSQGRERLKFLRHGHTAKQLRQMLINYKHLQRLYQNMPLDQVEENIDQRTFVMRKELDREKLHLEQLKEKLRQKLLEKALVENRIKYTDEYVLPEEKRCGVLLKKIEASQIRLRGNCQIYVTYQKMLQILRHDESFYDHILDSLETDSVDQENFIKYVIQLGLPATTRFTELGRTIKEIEDATRHQKRERSTLASMRGFNPIGIVKVNTQPLDLPYVRETKDMTLIKLQLQNLQNKISKLQLTTFCANVNQIFPSMKKLYEKNLEFSKSTRLSNMNIDFFSRKSKVAHLMESLLTHNLTEVQFARQERIRLLKKFIKNEEEKIAKNEEYIKQRGSIFVLLRHSLWTIDEILRYVGQAKQRYQNQYNTEYLGWPLLKYDMLNMISVSPGCYELNLDKILKGCKLKLSKIVSYLKEHKVNVNKSSAAYYDYYKETQSNLLEQKSDVILQKESSEEDIIGEMKLNSTIPTRKAIKLRSRKLVEELSKVEE